MFKYDRYRELLKEKQIKQEDLIKRGIINRGNATSLKNNKALNINTLDKICDYFDCQFSDIVEHYKEVDIDDLIKNNIGYEEENENQK